MTADTAAVEHTAHQPAAGAPVHAPGGWHAIDWPAAHHNVRRLQARIVQATQEGRGGKVKALQHLLTHSFSGKAIAVKRVTDNQGKHTPGVDRAIWNTPEKKMEAVLDLRQRRKQQFLPLPRMLVERLRDNTATALARYHLTYKGVIPPIIPTTPLLYVPRDLAPTLDKDLRAAGIPKYTKAGKLDFHALRVTYINLVIASGVNPKEAQMLARHATAELTIG